MTHDVYILDLDPCDLIIGVDWIWAFSPMTFDFRKLQLSFDKEGEKVYLYGENANVGIRLQKKLKEKRMGGD